MCPIMTNVHAYVIVRLHGVTGTPEELICVM